MPIYPYVCTACGHEFDALQKISDDPLTDCPECGESRLKKRLAAPAFQLKGTGWYETDFKNSGKKAGKNGGEDGKKDAKSDSGKDKSGAGGETKSSSSSDAKPAAAAGGKDD